MRCHVPVTILRPFATCFAAVACCPPADRSYGMCDLSSLTCSESYQHKHLQREKRGGGGGGLTLYGIMADESATVGGFFMNLARKTLDRERQFQGQPIVLSTTRPSAALLLFVRRACISCCTTTATPQQTTPVHFPYNPAQAVTVYSLYSADMERVHLRLRATFRNSLRLPVSPFSSAACRTFSDVGYRGDHGQVQIEVVEGARRSELG